MIKKQLIVTVALTALYGGLMADEPKSPPSKKPQWQRMLSAKDEATAIDLERRIVKFEENDQYAEAIPIAEKLLALRVEKQGADHWQAIREKYWLAQLKAVAKQPVEKRREWMKLLDQQQGALEPEKRGQAAKVLELRQDYHKICEEILGPDHPETGQSANNLAFNLNAQGKFRDAHPWYLKGLEVRRRTLGELHPDTASSYNNVGSNLGSLGRIAEAEAMFRKSLDISREVMGEDHPETAQPMNGLAGMLLDRSKLPEAEALYRRSLEIYAKANGPDHISTAIPHNNLGYVLNAMGLYAEADIHYRRSLEIKLKLLGEDHPSTSMSYNNVAYNLSKQGKNVESQALYEKALNIARKTLGENNLSTAMCYNNLAGSLTDQGNFAKAEPLYRKALEITRQVAGDGHVQVGQLANIFGTNLSKHGKYDEADKLLKEAVTIRRRVFGENHPDTAQSINYFARNLRSQNKIAEALPLMRQSLAVYRQTLGDLHPFTAQAVIDLAQTLSSKTDRAEIEQLINFAARSAEASRLVTARGIDRSNVSNSNERLLLAVLIAKDRPAEAWRQVELSLARGLFDQQSTELSRLTAAERQRAEQVRDRLAALQPQIANLASGRVAPTPGGRTLEQLVAERSELGEELSSILVRDSERAIVGLEQVQSTLTPDSAIVYWVDVRMREQFHWACVVRKTGAPTWVPLVGASGDGQWSTAEVELANDVRNTLSTTGFSPKVDAFAKQRLAPLRDQLAGVKNLHVVPVGMIVGIPVEAIAPDVVVDYVPSGSYLHRLQQQPRRAGQKLLAVGDPKYSPMPTVAAVEPLPPGGLLITQVVPGGAGASAGLKGGDVMLTYAGQEVASLDKLKELASANGTAKTIPITIWREGEAKTATKEVTPGKLGVVFDPDPAPQAVAARRKTSHQLAMLQRGGAWTELPVTAAEVESLKSLFPQSTTFTRDEASPAKLNELRKAEKLADYQYIHFATHGEGNSRVAFQSSLILHGDDKSVARLTAREVLDTWKLNAELVTLSACETAIGTQSTSDGLLGFAQAFLTAGSRSVCLSLWKVDDGATALLMDRFYRNLVGKRDGLTKPMTKAAALAEAKSWLRELSTEDATDRLAKITKGVSRGAGAKPLELVPPKADPATPASKKPFEHPRYWAAFILIGDPN